MSARFPQHLLDRNPDLARIAAMTVEPKENKYGNRRTTVDGIGFASAKEARRYGELKLMVRAGEIRALRLQPRYPLAVNDRLVTTYVGDFDYEERDGVTWTLVTEDAKGMETDVFKIKRELFAALMGREIRIT